MIGALKIWLSKTIANLFPIPLEVALPNFLDPTLSKLNVTTVSLEVSSTLTPASTRLSPFIIILLLHPFLLNYLKNLVYQNLRTKYDHSFDLPSNFFFTFFLFNYD